MIPSTPGPLHMLFLLPGTLAFPLAPTHSLYLNTETLSPTPRLGQIPHCTVVPDGAPRKLSSYIVNECDLINVYPPPTGL